MPLILSSRICTSSHVCAYRWGVLGFFSSYLWLFFFQQLFIKWISYWVSSFEKLVCVVSCSCRNDRKMNRFRMTLLVIYFLKRRIFHINYWSPGLNHVVMHAKTLFLFPSWWKEFNERGLALIEKSLRLKRVEWGLVESLLKHF